VGLGRAVQVHPMKPKSKPPGLMRLKLKCDVLRSTFAFEFNLRRYTLEVLAPALSGAPPTPPRILSLSSSHTALLCRHLDARDLVVGCDAFYEETYDGGGGGSSSSGGGNASKMDDANAKIPRVNPWAPNLTRVKELRPTLVICAYEAGPYTAAPFQLSLADWLLMTSWCTRSARLQAIMLLKPFTLAELLPGPRRCFN
jgi:hypothetical protein